MKGTIVVNGVEASGRHGVAPFERERPTNLLVDVKLHLDLTDAATKDDLDATIDYTTVVDEVRRITSASSFGLIETLAYTIARRMLELGARKAKVKVAKPAVAALLNTAELAVTVQLEAE